MRSINPSLGVNLAIVHRSGEIASVNDGWKRFGRSNGLQTPHFGVGSNYLECCTSTDDKIVHSVGQIRKLLRGEVDLVSFAYRCDSPGRKRAFVMIGAPLSREPEPAVALLHLNV